MSSMVALSLIATKFQSKNNNHMSIKTVSQQDVRVALVGAGSIGSIHFQALTEFAKVKVVGIVDESAELRAKYAERGVRGYATLGELASKELPNAVLIATPPNSRLQIASEAFELGLHQLHEKPLGFDLAQAEAISALASRHPELVVKVGYCHHFVPAVERSLELIRSGELGSICWINVDFVGNLAGAERHWFLDPVVAGGGSCMGVTCHSIDLFLHLAGRVVKSAGFLQHDWPGRAESADAVVLQSEGGTFGTLKSSYNSSLSRAAFEIVGTEDTVIFNYDEPETLQRISKAGEKSEEKVESAILRFVRQDQAWVDAIGGSVQPLLADVERGVEVARIIESIYRS